MIKNNRLSEDQYEKNFSDIHPPFETSNAALVEANRCLFCYDAPCTKSCPTGINVPKFIKQITTGDLKGSAHTIYNSNIMGAGCSKVCPVEKLCEGACVFNLMEEESIPIARLQRYATETAMAKNWQLFKRAPATGKKVAIIGAGPAGLSCAHMLSRLGVDATIFEKENRGGGLMTYGIAAYKVTPQFCEDGCRTLRFKRASVSDRHRVKTPRRPQIMKTRIILRCAVLLLSLLASRSARAEAEQLLCGKANAWLAAGVDSAEFLKYAPSREIDILHLALDVTPDFKVRTVSGTATFRFKPIAKPYPELKLDGIDLAVSAVTSPQKILGWQATDKNVIVTFADAIPADKEASVTITYRATPQKGLYFRTPEMGYPSTDSHLWTQGEPFEARHWFPSFDAPNEKFTSEVICRVPEGMVVISNGKKMSEEKDAATGLVAVRWLQDKPHANYLIALCAGYFKKVEDMHRDIPMAFWTPASQVAQAQSSFRDTKDM